jgi:hypothetical protein
MAVPIDCMETFVGEIDNVTPGAGCTCTVTVLLDVSPSPAAVTVTVADDTGAKAEADRVSVTGFELLPFAGVIGFCDHPAVTPEGSPLTEKLMLPVKDPAVAAVNPIPPELPAVTATELAPGVSVSVAGTVTVSP